MNPSEAWDIAAEAWDDFVESGKDYYRIEVHGPALLDACGDVAGLGILDLGCGQGWSVASSPTPARASSVLS